MVSAPVPFQHFQPDLDVLLRVEFGQQAHRLDMSGLGKHIDGAGEGKAIGGGEQLEVAGEGGGITGDVNELWRGGFAQGAHDGRVETLAGRVDDDRVEVLLLSKPWIQRRGVALEEAGFAREMVDFGVFARVDHGGRDDFDARRVRARTRGEERDRARAAVYVAHAVAGLQLGQRQRFLI